MRIVIIILLSFFSMTTAKSQDQEIQQLILNVEKLAQFKQILADMKKGYDIVTKGYTAIRDLSQGNFQLHKLFLDGLLAVSPAVKKYYKVSEIVSGEISLVKQYKKAFNRFKASGAFNPDELEYLLKVYSHLVDASLEGIGDLTTVVTANRLRMSDEDRLAAIDRLHAEMKDRLFFLRFFNNQNSVLQVQRIKEGLDVEAMRSLTR
ncbi:TerB family tellurite resistance protein [Foetidibacter luteolus]|uniref:TerB family tellurite resistance protein n=1 Tax=Foetidibacter luteolus TaxID=2608880 RepID=UPI00129B008D|nr:TerB family tellurite resistance protein [Foetidibacter luteolus]